MRKWCAPRWSNALFVSQQRTSAAFIAVHHFKAGPMAGVYGSSLPLGSACFHAPLRQTSRGFCCRGRGKGGSKNLQRGLSSVAWICGVWVINHASIHVKPLGVQTILRAAREEPIWAPSSIYTTTKQEHSIYCTTYIIRIQWRPYRARGLEHIVGGH